MQLTNRFSKLFLLSLGWAILSFSACKTDLVNAEVVREDAEFAVPLISTSFTLQQLLNRFDETTLVTILPDGGILVTYEGDLLEQGSEDVLASFEAALPPGLPVLDTFAILPLQGPEGIDIQLIDLKDGLAGYQFTSNHAEPIDLTISFPQVTKNGQQLELTASIPGPGTYNSLPPTGFPTDLTGYNIDPDVDGNLEVRYIALKNGVDRDTLDNVIVFFANLAFDYVEGDLGSDPFINDPGTIEIDIFEEFLRGEVWFQDPSITMIIENSIGLPARSYSNYFQVVTVDGEILPLRSDELGPNLEVDFDYPSINEIGETKTTTYTFTKENSNIDSILGAGPVAIEYNVDAIPNPDGPTEDPGFIACESKFKLRIKAELPMYGRANGFGASDEFPIDLSEYDKQNVKALEFKLVTESELPMDIGLQGYFLDANGAILDSLFTEMTTVIASPEVDDDGISIDDKRTERFITIGEDRLPKLVTDAKKIRLSTSFSTTDVGTVPVRILASQEVRVRMGLKVLIGE